MLRLLVAALVVTLVACGGGGTESFGVEEAGGSPDLEYVIPVGAGEALDPR